MTESVRIQIREDDIGIDKEHGRADHFIQKVNTLERTILVANFILELPSAAFDQLSSVHKPQYALISTLMSFTVLIISIMDLAYKRRKQRVFWTIRGLIPWFYYPYPNSKPFGTFPDIVGLVCAMFQCLFASITYAFLSRKVDNPVKMSAWPIIFAFGLLYSRLLRNPPQKKLTQPERRLNKAIEFTVAELATATDNFAVQNKLGLGSYGSVFKGKLANGSEVAVKRGQRGRQKRFSEEEHSAFESELELLSRLHHKHLVRLIGYHEDDNEMLLAYEYISNGSLFDHLHDKNNSIINSWKMRIKIALEAARGIEYLQNYAVLPITHRDIKSSNILLDADWTARVSGLGFSLMAPESEQGYRSTSKAEDFECYGRNLLAAKSDIYGFGVVLLEILTGKRAIFKDIDNGGTPESIVYFAVRRIMSGEMVKI